MQQSRTRCQWHKVCCRPYCYLGIAVGLNLFVIGLLNIESFGRNRPRLKETKSDGKFMTPKTERRTILTPKIQASNNKKDNKRGKRRNDTQTTLPVNLDCKERSSTPCSLNLSAGGGARGPAGEGQGRKPDPYSPSLGGGQFPSNNVAPTSSMPRLDAQNLIHSFPLCTASPSESARVVPPCRLAGNLYLCTEVPDHPLNSLGQARPDASCEECLPSHVRFLEHCFLSWEVFYKTRSPSQHGFENLDTDGVTFIKQRTNADKSVSKMMLSIHVDDGLAASNDNAMYQQFLQELRTDFELNVS